MVETNRNEDRSTWAIGAGVLIGLGTGFFFLQQSALIFVGCLILGLGIGLMVTTIISSRKS